MIIKTSKNPRDDLLKKIVAFSKLGSDVSARTADVVKGIKVFALQFYTFLSIDNFYELIEDEELKAIFADP